MAASRNSVLRVSRGETFAGETDLEVMVCSSCAVLYAVPARLLEKARSDHDTNWCCPNGHSQYFPGDTPETRERKLKERLDDERARAGRIAAERDQLEASLRGTRARAARTSKELKSVKTRVANGVCPCCGRTFQQLARHMKTKHPGYVPEASS